MQDKPDPGEQALSKAVEAGLSSQLDEVENMNVDIRTDLGKVLQGELNSVSVNGKGMVMQKDLRVQEMNVQTGKVAINPMSAVFGRVELKHPIDADTHVVLTEQDINRAFNSEYIRDKLQNLDVKVDGQPATIDTQQVEFRLPGDSKVGLSADILLRETDENKQVSFTTTPRMNGDGQSVSLEDVQYIDGQEISPELTTALLDKAGELLDLRNFELEGMSLRLKGLDVQQGSITLQAEAHVEQIPSA